MYIIFDIGGTSTRLATSKDGTTLENVMIISTSQDFQEGVDAIIDFAQAHADKPITAVAGGIAGPLSSDKSMIVHAPNIKDWNQKPLKRTLEEKLEAPVYLENDTVMIGIGEAHLGAGKNSSIVAYLTVSTGIGGARIVDGELDRNSFGFEPGHQIITSDNETCACGGSGHLEALASGTALSRKYHLKPEDIDDQAIWDNTSLWIARGIINTMAYWSPHVIILGGSLMKKLSLSSIKEHVNSLATIFPTLPPIKAAALDNIGGLHGALLYVTKKHPL